jgi:hypothetical protein
MTKRRLTITNKDDAEIREVPPLTPHGEFPRGPEGLRTIDTADGDPEEYDLPPDFGILDRIIGRLIKKSPFAEPMLGLEILDGPYKGIVFSFREFTFMPAQSKDGLVPTRYETDIHTIPPSLKASFRKDEAFDTFTTEILIAWIGYIHTNDLSPLIKMNTPRVQ